MRSAEVLSPETSNRPKMEMPLPKVPGPEKRKNLPLDRLNTAGHELNHMLAAFGLGVPIISFSLVPTEDSLARTFIAGTNPDAIKIIAAAGSVATHDGCAHGYWSDMHTVNRLTHYHGGISGEKATDLAGTLIAKYPIELRKKAAEIMVCLEEGSGSDLYEILTRAQIELSLEKGILGNLFVSEYQSIEATEPKEKPKDYTVIDHLVNGDYRITYVIGGVTKKEELMCGKCKRINGHSKDCPHHNSIGENAKSDTIVNESEVPSSQNKLSTEGIIFSRT